MQPCRYSFRLVSAVVFLLLLMILSALFGGWGPFEEPVMASTPTVEQPVATSPASLPVMATPIAFDWLRESGLDNQLEWVTVPDSQTPATPDPAAADNRLNF
jgi:hypothetical protein